LWLRRYQEQGLAGIAERSRRPHVSPRRTGGEWEQQVVELRQRYPDWGARKLQVLLRQAGVRLPASTIHRILLRRGLVRAEPNQLWQMDFKGSTGWETAVGPLSVLDDHSRYLIALRGTWTTKAEPVREQLESAFSECGVPEAMLMEHGTPWWNANAPTGATWLTVWLMRQGIELHWSGYRHPQTQGKVERFHGSLQRADLSLTGCYIETIFPWPIGTNLELKLQLDGTLLVLATVVTCDPQVGNGIQFTKMLPEDINELRSFLEAAEKAE
jgi:transposase InsO family protein